MHDLTIIYLTANQQPPEWAKYQREMLLKAAGDYPILTVSRQPTGFGNAEMLDLGPKSHLNMYKQLVRAARTVLTPYIAVAEDDVLYSKEHFSEFRPGLGAVAYDMHRWSLYTWTGLYSVKDRISNSTLIAGRNYYIEAWEERFAKYPDDSLPAQRVSEIGRNNQERWMGVTERNCERFWATVPSIHLNHDNGTDSLGRRKAMGNFRAFSIPHWGDAEEIIGRYR